MPDSTDALPGQVATAGRLCFRWVDDWVELPDEPGLGQAHTAVAVTPDDEIIFAHSTRPELIIADSSGRAVRRVLVEGVGEFHGLEMVVEDGEPLVWIADTGRKSIGGSAQLHVIRGARGGQVFAVDLDGNRRRELADPDHAAYRDSAYVPTAVVVDEHRVGGTGDIWVADGYGASLVHRYDAGGRQLATLEGATETDRFRQPHGLIIDRRKAVPELYVADRQNSRILVFGLDGQFKRAVGGTALVAPSAMAVSGQLLFITDLIARRVTVLDSDDTFVAHLFPHPHPLAWGTPVVSDGWPDAWPNLRSQDGAIVRPLLMTGTFNSPHGIAADTQGNVYVAEFLLGGRPVKLERI